MEETQETHKGGTAQENQRPSEVVELTTQLHCLELCTGILEDLSFPKASICLTQVQLKGPQHKKAWRVVSWPAKSAPRKWLEMQIIRPTLDLPNQNIWGRGPPSAYQ